MNNDFWYIFSMVLIVISAAGLGIMAGYIVGLRHGVDLMLEGIDDDTDELLDAEELI